MEKTIELEVYVFNTIYRKNHQNYMIPIIVSEETMIEKDKRDIYYYLTRLSHALSIPGTDYKVIYCDLLDDTIYAYSYRLGVSDDPSFSEITTLDACFREMVDNMPENKENDKELTYAEAWIIDKWHNSHEPLC